ncbi:MAG: hypothetical protein V2I33_20405 [Kangiellaceae bacterium]|nr:hypothetical protein [Kangiellaceae bacterium]
MKANRAAGTDPMNSSNLAITLTDPVWMMLGFSLKLNDDAVTSDIVFTWNRSVANSTWGVTTTSGNLFHQFNDAADGIKNFIGATFNGTTFSNGFAGFIYAVYITSGTVAVDTLFPHPPTGTCTCAGTGETCFVGDDDCLLINSAFNKQDDNSNLCDGTSCTTSKQCRYAICSTCHADDDACALCYDANCTKCSSFATA